MSLTHKLLKELQLNDTQIEQIIAAHVSITDALKAERDAALQEAEGLHAQVEQLSQAAQSTAEVQAAFDSYRSQVESAQQTQQAQKLLRLTLIQASCNEQVVDLLIRTLDPAALAMDSGRLVNESALLNDLRKQYAQFFAQPVHLSVPSLQPPLPTGGALTREDLSRMSAEEINRNWNAVKGVLAKGAI